MSRRWTGRWRDPRTGIVHSVREMTMVDQAYLTRMRAACTRVNAIKSAWKCTRAVSCLFCLTMPHGVESGVPAA